ncbi:MAG: hypothetical protein JXB05_27675, partial [Myxococcaceae bacterium]|nr:hypothetical protein [Myxococcaceae bacterium]
MWRSSLAQSMRGRFGRGGGGDSGTGAGGSGLTSRPSLVTTLRRRALGPKTPWKRVRWRRGGGSSVASCFTSCPAVSSSDVAPE